MKPNSKALQWEERVVREKRASGRPWKAIVRDFINLNNFAGVDIAMRMRNDELMLLDSKRTYETT